MATNTNLKIYRGDAETITEVVSNLASLTGYVAKLYIEEYDGTVLDVITGTIATLTITYELTNNETILYTVGVHKYETKVIDTSDHVYTLSYGTFTVEDPLNKNPHTT